jgi:hypothetical protein
MLERQIAQAGLLRSRLQKLQGQLSSGDEPELADLLTTLELMTMYDKYFTPEELKQMPLYQADNAAISAEWATLVAEVSAMMANGTTAQDPAAQALATRWMSMVGRDTNHDARLFTKLNHMHEQEPALQAQTGITPELMAFVLRASAEARYVAFANYLNDDEMAFLKANFTRRGREWPGLFAEVRQQMALGTAPEAPAMQALAARWADLFASYAGTDPATHAKIHAAQRNEPALRAGSFVTGQMVAYVKQAMALLPTP